jgi:hypothetical protein
LEAIQGSPSILGKVYVPPPTINFLINSLSILGKNWSGSLKNISFLVGGESIAFSLGQEPSLALCYLASPPTPPSTSLTIEESKSSIDSEEKE